METKEKKECGAAKHSFMSFILGLLVGLYPVRWLITILVFIAGLAIGLTLGHDLSHLH